MSQDENAKTIQINVATDQQIAGGDHLHITTNSLKLLLAIMPREQLDALSLEKSEIFRRRFGFETPIIVREQVLAIQQQYDFTDREIRKLKRSSHLQVTRTAAYLQPDHVTAWAGWAQFIVLCQICALSLLHISTTSAPAWKQSLGQLVITVLWMVAGLGLYRLYISSGKLLSQVGVPPASWLSRAKIISRKS